MKKSKVLLGVLAATGVLTATLGIAQPADQDQGGMTKGTSKSMSRGAHKGMKSDTSTPADTSQSSNTGMVPREWQKGDKLTAEYRDRQYMIDDYRQYGLPAPPKGQHWVGIGAQYLLVRSNGTVVDVGSATR